MRRILASLISLVWLVVCSLLRAEETRSIEYRMKPGDSATYLLHAETTTDYSKQTTSKPEKRRVTFRSDMQVSIRCVGVSDEGEIRVEITYPEFIMETTMLEKGQLSKIITDRNGARSYLDGKLEESQTWGAMEKQRKPNLLKLFSSTVEFTLDKRGRVLDVKVPAELAGQFGGVDIKQFFQQQVIFPEMPVSPGTEWSQTSERQVPEGPGPLGGKAMVDDTTYTYEADETVLDRQCAKIRIATKSRPKEKILDLKEFTQTNEGFSLAALENGQPVKSELNLFQEMKGTPGGVKTELKTTGVVMMSLMQPPATEPPKEGKPPEETKSGVE